MKESQQHSLSRQSKIQDAVLETLERDYNTKRGRFDAETVYRSGCLMFVMLVKRREQKKRRTNCENFNTMSHR